MTMMIDGYYSETEYMEGQENKKDENETIIAEPTLYNVHKKPCWLILVKL